MTTATTLPATIRLHFADAEPPAECNGIPSIAAQLVGALNFIARGDGARWTIEKADDLAGYLERDENWTTARLQFRISYSSGETVEVAGEYRGKNDQLRLVEQPKRCGKPACEKCRLPECLVIEG